MGAYLLKNGKAFKKVVVETEEKKNQNFARL
jgi:hypothetical protein